jgi:hypothetical protein
MLIITPESHLDHSATSQQLAWLLKRYATHSAFFIETFVFPDELGTLPCGLYGPIMGDPPVVASAAVPVSYAPRNGRAGNSRLVALPPRPGHGFTVVAGPDEQGNPCVLYTVYGGPQAPREPWDPGLKTPEQKAESETFWAQHALGFDV